MNEKVSLQNFDSNSRPLATISKPGSPFLKPSNLALTAVGGLGLAGILFWEANLLSYAITLAGFGLSFFRSAASYIFKGRNLQAQADREQEAALYELKRKIRRTQFLGNVENLGERLNSQFDQVRARFQELDQTLRGKFNPGELTFSRYAGAIQQSYFSLIDQLENSADLLQSLSLTSDDSLPGQTEAADMPKAEEFQALQQRQALRAAQKSQIEALLALHEKVLAQWEHLLASLRQIKTREHAGGVDLEANLSELRILAEKAKKYSL